MLGGDCFMYASIKKRGRPFMYGAANNYIVEKKINLFGKDKNNEYMSLINLAYHTNKITSEERNIASFLEMVYLKVQKGLGLKRLPSSSPNTWQVGLQSAWNIIGFQDDKAEKTWKKVVSFLKLNQSEIYNEFINLISAVYSYEDLVAMKYNNSIMETLKICLKEVKTMFDLGYL